MGGAVVGAFGEGQAEADQGVGVVELGAAEVSLAGYLAECLCGGVGAAAVTVVVAHHRQMAGRRQHRAARGGRGGCPFAPGHHHGGEDVGEQPGVSGLGGDVAGRGQGSEVDTSCVYVPSRSKGDAPEQLVLATRISVGERRDLPPGITRLGATVPALRCRHTASLPYCPP